MKLQQKTRLASAIGLTALPLTLGYMNCSKVDFAVNMASVIDKLDTKGGIVINNGDEFTNSKQVQLSLNSGEVSEMYVTNDETCKEGGVWEPYTKEKPWMLADSNKNARVFVKFREAAVKDAESSCFSDDITHDDVPPVVDIKKGVDAFINVSDVNVEFVVTDTGAGVESASCVQDGVSDPQNCPSTRAWNGLSEGPHSLVIRGKDKAGNLSEPATVAFMVDKTPPAVVLNSTPSLVTSGSLSEFKFSATDSSSGIFGYECRLDGSPEFKACSSPFSAQLSEGKHTFVVRAKDNAGNTSADVIYSWTIDQTAPDLKFTKTPADFSNSAAAQFEFVGTDDGQPITQFRCSIDGGNAISCVSPHSLANLSAGSHTFTVRGIDSAGNLSQPIGYTWLVDLTKPTLILTAKPDVVTKSLSATFAFQAQDAQSGVAKIECQIDSGAFASCASPTTYASLTEGTHKFTARAFDKAGNVSDPVSHTWRIDVTNPTLDILSGPASLTVLTEADFVMSAVDPGGELDRIECKIDAEPAFTPCSSPKRYQSLLEGSHLFSARAVDKVGNMSSVKTYAWIVDVTGPAINFSKVPLSNVGQLYNVEFQYLVTDNFAGVDTIQCGMDGSLSACPASGLKTYGQMAVGAHSFTMIAKDKLGNVSRKDIDFTVTQSLIDKTQIYQITRNMKLDVLVVIDNSGSMATEQSNMSQRFSTFLDQLNGLDWQVGIVTTDMEYDSNLRDGRLVPLTGLSSQYIVTSSMDPAYARQLFGATIKRSESGSGSERGIAATYRAIQRSLDSAAVNAPNRALFRQDAALAVLVVTDADETNPNGFTVMDQPEGLINLVKATWNNQKAFTFHSIVVKSGDSTCKSQSSNEWYGETYEQLSNLTGGVIGSVCATDYGSQLSAMGQTSAALVNSISLECMPVDKNADGKLDVAVTLSTGAQVPTYTVDGTKVTFSQALPIGDVQLKYSCLAN